LFADANLRFCRYDGSPLISEATSPAEDATILFTTGDLINLFTLEELRRRSEEKLSR
jgi:hypothetical protein